MANDYAALFHNFPTQNDDGRGGGGGGDYYSRKQN